MSRILIIDTNVNPGLGALGGRYLWSCMTYFEQPLYHDDFAKIAKARELYLGEKWHASVKLGRDEIWAIEGPGLHTFLSIHVLSTLNEWL